MTLNIFEDWARAVFLGTAENFQLRIEIADKHDIVGKVVDSFKDWISIWVVNKCGMHFECFIRPCTCV